METEETFPSSNVQEAFPPITAVQLDEIKRYVLARRELDDVRKGYHDQEVRIDNLATFLPSEINFVTQFVAKHKVTTINTYGFLRVVMLVV